MVEVREGAVRSEPQWMTKRTKNDESKTFDMRWGKRHGTEEKLAYDHLPHSLSCRSRSLVIAGGCLPLSTSSCTMFLMDGCQFVVPRIEYVNNIGDRLASFDCSSMETVR